MKRLIFRGFAILLTLTLCLSCLLPSYAEEEKIRIGYIDYEGFIGVDDEGNYYGYGVDLLNRISSYTGRQYEFVYDTFPNHFESLKRGEIDFLCHVQKTAEREESYLFSKYPTGSESGVLYVRSDDRFYYDDYLGLNGMTVGLLEGSFQNAEFAAFAQSNGFTYNEKSFSSREQAFSALDEKLVDAVAMGSLGGMNGYKVISLFSSDPFYFMTWTGNSDLLAELDRALGRIFAEDPTYTADLYEKYYGSSTPDKGILLTREEANYIASHPTAVVGLLDNRSPLSYRDENGQAAGILVDIMALIAEKSGLTFEYKFLATGQTGMSFLTETGSDIVAGVASSDFSAPNPALLQSNTILDAGVVFVGRNGMDFSPSASLTLALPSGFINGESIISAAYPGFQFYHCTSNEECLKAIRDGNADIMLQNMYIIRECLQSPLYENLQMFPAYEFPESEKIVALPGRETLISVINKTLASIPEEEIDDVVINNTIGMAYQAGTGEILYKFRLPLILIALLLLMVFVLIISLLLVRQRNYKATKKINEKLENSNLQLGDAVTQADNASAAKSLFLARMSHEIRTPMNAIVGLTAIARSHINEGEKIKDYLQKIDTSSRVLLNIINDVLDMSAIESNKMKISENDFDIKQVLNGISTIYYSQCKSKGIDFQMGADLPREMLIGDSLRVNQVLLNLVSNAFKFTPPKGKIKISAKETGRKSDRVFIRFTVADTGCGMSEDMKNRLFKPFEQESVKVTGEHGGSGLGLSIAKNLVEMMDGAIRVDSEKDKGTTFTVDIPFRVSDKDPDFFGGQVKELKALVVDDEVSAREYTGLILERIGIPFTVATSGEEALELLKKEEEAGKGFDVCFIDWKMPGMNGVELTKKIRKSDSGPLIIVVSAYDVTEIEGDAKGAGADVFVSKPLFQSTVFNLLMQLSGGKYKNETGSAEDYDFSGHKLLLAEDNELNREIATELLELVHMKVDCAEDGEEAVNRFNASEENEYDMILMDIQMPNLDGYEATRIIRSGTHPRATTVPIVAMTANAFSSDISLALSSGMNDHLAKPIDTRLLYQTLDKFILKNGGADNEA